VALYTFEGFIGILNGFSPVLEFGAGKIGKGVPMVVIEW
jgi:hypothetical protein